MIMVGLSLFIVALALAVVGVAGYIAARRSSSKSRYAALSLFGNGAIGSSGAIALLLFVHVDSLWPFAAHIQPLSAVITNLFDCDLDVSCALTTILLVTALMLLISFLVTQVSSRLLLRSYLRDVNRKRSAELAVRGRLPASARLLVVRDDSTDAFSFAILRGGGRRLIHGEDIIVLTSGLLGLLNEDEAEAVLAHEVAHVTARDDRYIPLFHTLSIILFFDPVLRVLRRRIGRHHEFAADVESARMTRRPLSLARALLKVYLAGTAAPRPAGLFGWGSRAELAQRIEALLALDAAGLRP